MSETETTQQIAGQCRFYDASVFETIIRILGGMLTAHELSGDAGFLTRCACLAMSPQTGFCEDHPTKLATQAVQGWFLQRWSVSQSTSASLRKC